MGLAFDGNQQISSRQMTDPSPPTPPQVPQLDTRSLVLFFWENWAVIKKHWVLFVLTVAICVGVTGYSVRQFDMHQIDILTTSNTQLRDHNTALMQNAGASPPSQWRRLSDGEHSTLIQALKQWSAKPKTLSVFAMAESESRQYAGQFLDVLRSVGIESKPSEIALAGWGGPVQPGLMVGVVNFDNPPPDAQVFLQILKNAGLDAQFTVWAGSPNENPAYDLFIGPKPW
jgi:hypothetical protein